MCTPLQVLEEVNSVLKNESVEEIRSYLKKLDLQNRERVLQKAVATYNLIRDTTNIRKEVIQGSCLYASAILNKENVTQRQISKLFNVSESSLNKGYKKIIRIVRSTNPKMLEA